MIGIGFLLGLKSDRYNQGAIIEENIQKVKGCVGVETSTPTH